MLMPSQRVRIVVATKPVEFRKGHDGLAALVQSTLIENPFTGTVFVFRSKCPDRLKILFRDESGKVIAYKRLGESTFRRDLAEIHRRCACSQSLNSATRGALRA